MTEATIVMRSEPVAGEDVEDCLLLLVVLYCRWMLCMKHNSNLCRWLGEKALRGMETANSEFCRNEG